MCKREEFLDSRLIRDVIASKQCPKIDMRDTYGTGFYAKNFGWRPIHCMSNFLLREACSLTFSSQDFPQFLSSNQNIIIFRWM